MLASFQTFIYFLLFITITNCYNFKFNNQITFLKSQRSNNILYARSRRGTTEEKEEKPAFIVGEDVPEELLKLNGIYDMILVERLTSPTKTSFGLILPEVEGKDRKHLGKVLSIPTSYGLESEQGRTAPISEICPYKVGDLVFLQVSQSKQTLLYLYLIVHVIYWHHLICIYNYRDIICFYQINDSNYTV